MIFRSGLPVAVFSAVCALAWAKEDAAPPRPSSPPSHSAAIEEPEFTKLSRVEALLLDAEIAIIEGKATGGAELRKALDKAQGLYKKALQLARATGEIAGKQQAQERLTQVQRAIRYYSRAQIQAKRDVNWGRLIYKVYGLPHPSNALMRQRLRRDYGIEMVMAGDCEAILEQVAQIEGYNSVSVVSIEKRFGKGILSKVAQEAAKKWNQKQGNTPAGLAP